MKVPKTWRDSLEKDANKVLFSMSSYRQVPENVKKLARQQLFRKLNHYFLNPLHVEDRRQLVEKLCREVEKDTIVPLMGE